MDSSIFMILKGPLLPLISLAFFAITAPLIEAVGRKVKFEGTSGIWGTLGFLAALYFVYKDYSAITFSNKGYIELFSHLAPIGVTFYIDGLSLFFSFTFILLGIFAAIFSLSYMKRYKGIGYYFSLLLLMVLGMIGVTFTGDFFNLFVFWELMSITSYVLVAYTKETTALEASFKYLVMASFGSLCMLMGIAFVYAMTGSLNFIYVSNQLSRMGQSIPDLFLYLTLILILIGFGIKAAIFPFWTWLPDAHPAAPAPISAMLSGVVITTGIYGFIRVFFLFFSSINFEWGFLIAILSALTMSVGNILALLQIDIKRMLAYSSIAHMGYVLAGISAGALSFSAIGITGAMLHVFNHALLKGLAFLCSGALIYRAGTRRLDELEGVGRRMPITMITLSIALLGLIGTPPFNGFISKLVLFMSTVSANITWLGIVLIANSAISSWYYLRLVRILARDIGVNETLAKIKEAPLTMSTVMLTMAVLIIIFGIWPQPIISVLERASSIFVSQLSGLS